MQKHIFFDFNGTIINDLDLCLDLLNQILTKQNKPTLSMEEYKNVFTFPIRDYYIAAGVDFNIESYESLAKWFIKEYQPASMKCGLFEGIVDTFKYLKEQGKPIFALPYAPGTAAGAGCNALIKEGAYLTETAADVFERFGIAAEEKKAEIPLTDAEEKTLNALKEKGEAHVNELASLSGIPPFKLLTILSSLEIKGLVAKLGGNRFSIV